MSPVTWVLEYFALKRLARDMDLYAKRLSSRLNDMERYKGDGRQVEFDRAAAEADALVAGEPQEKDYMPTQGARLFWHAAMVAGIAALVVWVA